MNPEITEDEIVIMTIDPVDVFVPFVFMTEEDAKYFIDNHKWFKDFCQYYSHIPEFEFRIRVMGSDVYKTFAEKYESIKKQVPDLQIYTPPKSTRN